MTETPPVVLSIAGFDPSSGAGVTADIKTIAACGCYAVACVTALTVQSTAGVRRVSPVEPALVRDTLEELASDLPIAAVHIGMLGSGEVAQVVADFLTAHRPPNVVLDPILKSSSGADLLDLEGMRLLTGKLIRLASVITPNVDEAAALTGLEVRNLPQMRAAALKLHEMGAAAVVVTGGHLQQAVDLLSVKRQNGVQEDVFKADRLVSNSTHGTGCAFSTALACGMALGKSLPKAVQIAKTFVTGAIAGAYPLGRGTGPVNHLFGFGARKAKTEV